MMSAQCARSLVRRGILRAARSLPCSSRVAVASSRSRLLKVSTVISSPINSRLFSSDLSDLLTRELEEEEAEATSLPDDLAELKESLSEEWTIMDDNESGTVRLVRKSGPSKVSVVFHCQDTLEVDYDEEGEEASPEVRFTLTVSKAGKTMVLNCLSAEAKAVVESVAMSGEDIEKIHSNGKVDDKLYQGPQFHELEEDVQEAFHSYVQTSCGITSDVAAFISMYADFKEQAEYLRWLKQVKGVLE